MSGSVALIVRPATPADAAALVDIYRPYVEATVVSFEATTPSVAEFTTRIEKVLSKWQWLVAEHEGVTVGYAYGSPIVNEPHISGRWRYRLTSTLPTTAKELAGRSMGACLRI